MHQRSWRKCKANNSRHSDEKVPKIKLFLKYPEAQHGVPSPEERTPEEERRKVRG